MIRIRPAEAGDVPAMSAVLIASITELCAADHRGDPKAIAAWTANKTAAGVAAMLEAPANRLFVAERNGAIAAVGCVIGKDEIGLNYVHPAHRFRGVSRTLLAAMETHMRGSGATEGRLKSTITAHAFYRANGWLDTGPLYGGRYIDAYRMVKPL